MRILIRSFLLSFLTVSVQEFFLTKSLMEVTRWFIFHADAAMVSILIVTVFFNVVYFSFNSYKAMILSSLGLMSLGAISFFKEKTLGLPLYPWDFQSSKETMEILLVILKHKSLDLVILSVMLILALSWSFFKLSLKNEPFRYSNLFKWLGYSVVLAILLLANNPLHDYLFHVRFKFYTNDKNSTMVNRGVIVGFIALIERGVLVPPTPYSDSEVESELTTLEGFKIPPKVKPDIIVIMSESLFDPKELKGINWKEDPLAFSRSLSKRKLSYAKVPTYGGKTANSEFEFLTGNSLKFFSQGTVPYELFNEKAQDSIVWSMKEVGYKAIAIHPGSRTFWNRDKVYQSMGFDKFLTGDEFIGAKSLGNYTSDESILPELKNSLAKQDSPSFHFIVTIQNHMPYTNNPFDLSKAIFDTKNVKKDDQVILNYYSQLVQRTDNFHKDLVEYLRTRNRPTILVVFGDHLPPLKDNFEILKTYGMVNNNHDNPTDFDKIYTTPLIVWSNFPQELATEPINLNFLGVKLLTTVGIPLSPYQKYVNSVYQQVPNFNEAREDNEMVRTYHKMQYYMLVNGKKKAKEIIVTSVESK